MHELSVTQEILDIAIQHAEQAQATRITDINVVIGDLSAVVGDSVQFYFDYLSPDTIAAGAKLHLERVSARLRCRQCNEEFEPQKQDWTCPNCQAMGGDVLTGREFFLDSIQVE